MKTYLIALFCLCIVSYISYEFGIYSYNKKIELAIQDEIAQRYQKYNVILTQEQTCLFERIIYNDSTECK